jgi:hypothetical protein
MTAILLTTNVWNINQSTAMSCKQIHTTAVSRRTLQQIVTRSPHPTPPHPTPIITFHARADGSLVVFSATGQ